jgi:hypothetical protein
MVHTSGLLLRNPPLVKRIATLFAELNEDAALQAAFIKSPKEVVGEAVLPSAAAPRQASAVNEFIFSVLADERLQRWLEKYRSHPDGQDHSAEQTLRSLGRAFIEYGSTKLQADTEFPPGLEFGVSIYVGNTYLRSLNSRTFIITRISGPPKQIAVNSMQIVSMVEQLLHCAKSRSLPAEANAS